MSKEITKKEKKFIVVQDFKDLQDNNRIYVKGDTYPAENAPKPAAARIKELSSTKNKISKVLIKEQG